MKIGIMGGTFDPVHNGHLMLGEYAWRLYQLDEVWFMPNAHPPHKSERSIESTAAQRVEMTSLAIAGHPAFKMCLYEVEYDGISYSYQTMRSLKSMYPNDDFYFIIGADSLFSIETWVHPEILFYQCRILAAYRDKKGTTEMLSQISYLNRKYGARIMLLKTPDIDISSSRIRERVKAGEKNIKDVPETVAEYIEANSLYKEV